MKPSPFSVAAPSRKTLGILGTVVAVGGGFFVARHFYLKAMNSAANSRAAGDASSPAALAKELHIGLFSWSENWPLAVQDSNETALLAVAPRIKDLAAVSREYKRMYRRELLDDLAAVFSSEEMQAFRVAAEKRGGGNSAPAMNQTDVARHLHSCIEGWTPCVDAAMTFAAHIRGYEAFKTLYRQTHGKELEAHLLSQWTFSQDDLAAFRRIAGAS